MSEPNSHQRSVLLLVSSNRRRGAEVFGETLAHGLTNAGWRVDFASLAAADSGPTVSARPLSSETPDTLSRLDKDVVRAVHDAIVDGSPDIVLANGSSTMQYAVAAVRWRRKRPRLVYVSIGEPKWWIRNSVHRMTRTLILKGIDRVFSVSATTAQQLVEGFGVSPDKLRIAPTGVPPRFFDIADTATRSGGPLRMVFIGNLSVEKGPLLALDVMTAVANDHEIEARFLGSGPLQSELEDLVAARTLGDRVGVLGSVADVAPHLEWADVLVMTSQTEGLPGVSLEAGAAGVPAVVFDVGGSAETVLDGRTGYVIPHGDVAAAADAVGILAADRELLAEMGKRARIHVGDNFTLAMAVQRYVTLLEDEVSSMANVQ